MARTIQRMQSGRYHFVHFDQEILLIPMAAIKYPDVGVKRLMIPSPRVKAKTAVCLVTPMKSASGAMMGIVTAALPEPEGTTTLRNP